MSDIAAPSIRIATFGPKPDEVAKLYAPIANDPGNDGVGVSISMADCLAKNWGTIDPVLALLPAGKVFRAAVSAGQADANGPYKTLTLPLSHFGNPPADWCMALPWDGLFAGDMTQAHHNLFSHFPDLGVDQQFEGFSLGGDVPGFDCECWPAWFAYETATSPFQNFSQQWIDAGYSPALMQQTMVNRAVAIAAISPGQLMTMCFWEAEYFLVGSIHGDRKDDKGATAISCFQAMMEAAAPARLLPVWQSAENGVPLGDVLSQLNTLAGGIVLQEKEGSLYTDACPGAVILERHITDFKPGSNA